MKTLLLSLLTLIAIATAATAQTIPSYIPTTGLIGWWPFNGNANDESGNNNNGTSMGATLTTDRFGNDSSAYLFDGTSTYISIPSSASLESPTVGLTMSAWVNAAGYSIVGQQYDPIITKTNSSNNAFMYRMDIDLNGTAFFAGINNWDSNTGTAYQFNLNQWYLVSAVLDTFASYLYINDTLVATQAYNTVIQDNNLPLEFGRDAPGYIEIFNGKLDDIGIWNKALTAKQVGGLFNGAISAISKPAVANNSLSIYPNPVTNQVMVHTQNPEAAFNYTIYDGLGRPVLTGKLTSANTTISLGHLTAGIYMLMAGDKIQQTFSIVKM